MKKFLAVGLITAALAAAPLAPAYAWGGHHGGPRHGEYQDYGRHRGHQRRHGHGGSALPLFLGLAAVTGAAVALSASEPPPPAHVYVAPAAPVVYAPQPVVQRTVVYPATSYTTTYYGY